MVAAIAWIILVLTAIFVILPIVGSCFNGFGSSYSEDLSVGIRLVLFIVTLCTVIGVVMWALGTVMYG